jgi:MerR family transcriptional regulator, redox-sensitive transcriptional activator SoxR
MESTESLTIGKLAALTDVRPSAIRYYESVGLLPEPVRQSGRRRYSHDTIRLIGTLRFAQRAGFSVSEIRTLFHGFGADVPPAARWRRLADKKMADLDILIANAERMRRALKNGLQCGCVKIEDCVIESDTDGCCIPQQAGAPTVLRRSRST